MACVTDFEAVFAGRRPGNDPDYNKASRTDMEVGAEARDDIGYTKDVLDPQTKEAAINAIGQDEFSMEAPTAQDNALIDKMSKNMVLDNARIGHANAMERLNEVMNETSATSASSASMFANLTSMLSTQFLHGMGDFFNYVSHHFGVDGRTATDHPVFRALLSMTPKTEAVRGVFKGFLDDWRNSIKQYAARAGLSPEELFMEIGNLAVYEHTPERNALLRKRWSERYAEVEKKFNSGKRLDDEETVIFETYPEMIEALDRNLNERYALFDENGERTVKSGGYLNGEAERLWDETVVRLGLSDEEAKAATAGLREVYMKMRDHAAQAGVLDPESVKNWPDFMFYVPVKTKRDATSGPTGDATIFDPGRFHAAEGMTATPMDAYTSIAKYGERIAHNIGQQDFGNAMQALWIRQREIQLDDPTFDAGIRSYEYDKVVNALASPNQSVRAWAQRIYQSADGGGIVVNSPYRDANGNIQSQRRLITFNPDWADTRFNTKATGAKLNQTLTVATKFGAAPTNILAKGLTKATSFLGQTVTRFNPLFSPANMNRDAFERMSHLAGREYTLANGTTISGAKLIPAYAANMASSARILFDALWRKLPEGSPAKILMDEYMRNGLHYQPSQGILPKKTELTGSQLKGFMQRVGDSSVAQTGEWVLKKLDGWNDYFNNVAALAHYKTLRDVGMTEAKASAAVLEMMNLYQSGNMAGVLQAVFPFVRPTMQAAGAMMRTFGFAPNARGQFQMNGKGWMGFGAMTAGYAMLMPLLRSLMGEDSEGYSRFDMLPLDDLLRATPLGIDNEGRYIKIPNGFGPMQTAVALAVGMDRWMSGQMSGQDVAFNTLKTVFKNISPNDWPSYSMSQDPVAWITQSLTPMTLRPVIDVAVNKNYAGRTIAYPVNDPSTPKSAQGRKSTPDIYVSIAKDMLKYTGLDLAPEQWRTLYEGYAKGPMRLFTELMTEKNLKAAGLDKTARQELGPALTALGATMFYGKQVNTEQTRFYDKLDRFNDKVRMAGVKLSSDVYGNDKEKRIAYQTKLLQEAGFSDEEIKEGLKLRDANNELRDTSREFGKKYRASSEWLESDEEIYDVYETYNNSRLKIMREVLEDIEGY